MYKAGKQAISGAFISSLMIHELMMVHLEEESIFPFVESVMMSDTRDSLPAFYTMVTHGETTFEAGFCLTRPSGKHSDDTPVVTDVFARVYVK